MNNSARELKITITNYKLDRFEKWRNINQWLDFNILDEDTCMYLLLNAKNEIETIKDSGNWLPRAPSSEEELYGKYGQPKLNIGKLTDIPQINIGLLAPPPKHILLNGTTGSGKSTTIRTIVSQFCNLPEDTHIIYIDPKGDALCYPEKFNNFIILNESNLKMGLNNPHNVSVNKWIDIVSEIIAARCNICFGKSCFAGIIRFIMGHLNSGNRGPILLPSLNEILQAAHNKTIAKQFSTKPGYIESLKQALQSVILESNGIFDCRRGLDINSIFDQGKNIVLDTRQFAKKTAMITLDLLVMQLLMRRLTDKQYSRQSSVLLIVDEADTVLDAQQTDQAFSGSMTTLELFFRLGRELNLMGCMGLSNLVSCRSPHIIGNMTYFICHRLFDQAIYYAMQTLQLPKGCENLLSGLPEGRAVFKQNLPTWHRPFLIDIDFVPIDKDYVSPLDMTVINKSVPDGNFYDIYGISSAIQSIAQNQNSNTQRDRALSVGNKLHEDSVKTLKTAATMLYQPFLNVFKKIDITNSGYQDKICDYLQENGLVDFEELNVWRLPKRIGYPTSKGFAESGIAEPNKKGRGSIAHRTLAHWIQTYYHSQGKSAEIEFILPGTNHPVDVAVFDGNATDAIEIVFTCSSNLEHHIFECFDKCSQVNSLTIVAITKKELTKVKKELDNSLIFNAHKHKITFKTINELYPQEYKQ
ncbi:MAG: DUF87 domain-containing protein [Phycisphaerae bacterium]|nr:DUF87 domain-containing protein [Phycisphaerae bacterium]